MALDLIHTAGLQPDQLVLEITEQAFEADLDTLGVVTRQLIEHGASVAVDDFGTGYSSLRYLHQLSLDIMKIDRTFVASMAESSANQRLVSGLITMGSSLGLQLIAEGKSNKEAAAVLGLSPYTVETHRSHIMQKLDLHNTAEIVLYAVRKSLVS